MANKWWVGAANDGDWSNTNNWATSRFGAGGTGVPASNDLVYVWDTDQAITAGLAQGSVDLNLLDIRFGGVIGTPSTALTIAVSGTSGAALNYAGTGAFCNIIAGTNGIDLLHVIRCAGVFRLAGGTTAEIRGGRSGTLEVAAAAVLSGAIFTAGMDANFDLNATAPGYGYFGGGGKITSKRSFAVIYSMPGATVRLERAAAITSTLFVAGNYEHQSSGTIAYAVAFPTARCTSVGNTTTFTVSASDKFEGGVLFDNEPGVTFTAAPTPIGATR